MRTVVATNLLIGCIVFSLGTDVNAGCLRPGPGLKAGQQDVDTETVNFNYGGEAFGLDIFSGYAAQPTNRNVFCLRYEVENTSHKPIEKLYWPMASGLQIDALQPKAKPSIAVTTPPGTPPVLGSTWVYAFLSEAVKTVAYQQNKQYVPYLRDKNLPTPGFGFNSVIVPARYAQSAEINAYELKEPREFPEIGSQFTDQKSEVVASSLADWNGKNYTLGVRITRSNVKDVKEVQAPFAYALIKSGSSSDLLSLTREFKKSGIPLPMEKDEFIGRYSSSAKDSSIYVVQQPITVLGPSGKVCFLAAAYSPIPMPENLMTCSLTAP
jgi:hypothetical protein